MMASWYRALFQRGCTSARAPLQELVTTQGGFRLATSVGGCSPAAARISSLSTIP